MDPDPTLTTLELQSEKKNFKILFKPELHELAETLLCFPCEFFTISEMYGELIVVSIS